MEQLRLLGAELVLSFETEPTVPAINPQDVVLKSVEAAWSQSREGRNETIRQVQLFFAEWKKLEQEPVQEGHFVLLDVDVIETEPPVRLFSAVRFESERSFDGKMDERFNLGS
jgi:FKBP-type peptidyl-prolyl cis-trans isomerase (trigger factor)